jgi:hypothetical protein
VDAKPVSAVIAAWNVGAAGISYRETRRTFRPRYDHHVRITVAHTKSKEEIKRAIDRTFDDLFKGIANMPVQIVDEKRAWTGDILYFSFGAKVSLLTSPIKGTIEVTDREVIIEADLGLLEKLLPAAQTRATLENRVRGLLN